MPRRDPALKDLLRIHLGAPEAGEAAAPARIPALCCGYTDLAGIRHDYPLVLHEGQADRVATSLARMIDAIVDAGGPSGSDGDRFRRDLYAIEARIKALTAGNPYGQLSELWVCASDALVKDCGDAERRESLQANLKAARAAFPARGSVIGCDASAPRKVFAHAWDVLQAEQAERERASLSELAGSLRDILDADKAFAPAAISAEALSASMGSGHAQGIDFGALSDVLRGSKHHRPLTGKRRKRIKAVLKVLDKEQERLSAPAGNGAKRRKGGRPATTCGSCAEAKRLLEESMERMVGLFRAVRIARLEAQNRYMPERHDAFFESFGAAHLAPEECRALPPVLLYLDGDALTADDKASLFELLASDLPVKVLLEVRRIADSDLKAGGSVAAGAWQERAADVALALGDAFVTQAAVSQLPGLMPVLAEGLSAPGPALFSIYTGPAGGTGAMPHYLHCAAAVESRAFPCFVHAPGRGETWAERFSVDGNAAVDCGWSRQSLDYEGPEGAPVSEELAFTYVDFLAADPRFAGHFEAVPADAWHDSMLPVAEYLEMDEAAAFGRVPYVLMSDGDGGLARVVVRRAPIAAARRAASRWRSLQELAGIGNSHALRLVEAERQRLEAERDAAIAEMRESLATEAPAAPAGAAETGAEAAAPAADAVVEAPAEEAAERDPDQAWIDTPMCTSCNDCTDRNGLMFGYDDAKQAFIKDVTAGTYREMVEAAENCPVCIIHPGKPWNADEAGLAELVARAEAL